jgi:4-amino-4-deoxy-L-arabinose transferase-like glycosyltransferase
MGKRFLSSHLAWFLLIAGFHIAVALCLKEKGGLDIAADRGRSEWDYFWQHLPLESLKSDLWRSVWHLHAQPPLYNIYGGLMAKALGPRHLQGLHFANILFGGLLSGLTYVVAYTVSRRFRFSIVVAALLALNPALFLYEAHMLYDVMTAFLVVLSCAWLAFHALRPRVAWLVLFILTVNLLILCRSMFHVALLAPLAPLACLLAGRRWKRLLAFSLVIGILSVGWYAKNLAQFGFFGSSSWSGMNLWRVAWAYYTPDELDALVGRGIVHPVTAKVEAFEKPSLFVAHGFRETSDVRVLALDNYNNVNIPAIADMYGTSALRLIRHDPRHYLRNVGKAYRMFCRPSSKLRFLDANREKIRALDGVASDLLQGYRWLGGDKKRPERHCNSFVFFLLPAAMALLAVSAARACRGSVSLWVAHIRSQSVLVFLGLIVGYVCLVGCTHELGETDRFKFSVEAPLGVLIFWSSYRFGLVPLRGLWSRLRQGGMEEPAARAETRKKGIAWDRP